MTQKIREIMTGSPITLTADQPVGIVSIGDLAIERDQRSALAEVSAASPNH